jgi:hypothetical protein
MGSLESLGEELRPSLIKSLQRAVSGPDEGGLKVYFI